MTKTKTKFLPITFVLCLLLAVSSVCFINTSALASDNNSNQASEVHDYSKDNGYMVRIYGINHKDLGKHDLDGKADDPDGSVTFGPAAGETKDCLSVNKSKEHKHNHGHCLATESWDQIIKHIQEGGAEDYRECLEEGCTHAVELDYNSQISRHGPMNAQYSSIFGSINEEYTLFNSVRPHQNENPKFSNYGHSRIRATLNGKTGDEWQYYAGPNLLDSDHCLLSCFPKILQANIKAKTFDLPLDWEIYPHCGIKETYKVEDKLWLASELEIYGPLKSKLYRADDYGSRYLDNIKTPKVYSEWGESVSSVLRSPCREYYGPYLASIDKYTGSYAAKICDGTGGLCPFFCL